MLSIILPTNGSMIVPRDRYGTRRGHGRDRYGDGAAVQTVNARELHAFLEVGKDFSTWVKDRIEQYGFNENSDFVCSPILGSESSGGHPAKEYAVFDSP
jgi:hypothetical protein